MNSVSLYIHIPFCKKKCSYCDFFSSPCSLQKDKKYVPDSYLTALCIQAESYAKIFNVESWKTIYIGGGTPSLLTAEQLEFLLGGIKKAAVFADECEVTMEMNPDDISESLLAAAKKSGVTRISVGIQSLSDEVLKAVDRRCSRQTSLTALELLHKKWQGGFSADLISGLPLDSREQLEKTICELLSFEPDHISLYSLTLEEETPLGRAVFSGNLEYDYETADDCWLAGRNLLEKNGYRQYEVSNFAKPGFESMHNKTYWKLENYIGLGAGGTGTIYSCFSEQKSRNFQNDFSFCMKNAVRWTGTQNLKEFTSFWNDLPAFSEVLKDLSLPCEKTVQPASVEFLDRKTQEFEFLMMGFRLLEGVCADEYAVRFGKSLAERLGAGCGGLFDSWNERGLAVRIYRNGQEFFALTADGILLLNQFLQELLD